MTIARYCTTDAISDPTNLFRSLCSNTIYDEAREDECRDNDPFPCDPTIANFCGDPQNPNMERMFDTLCQGQGLCPARIKRIIADCTDEDVNNDTLCDNIVANGISVQACIAAPYRAGLRYGGRLMSRAVRFLDKCTDIATRDLDTATCGRVELQVLQCLQDLLPIRLTRFVLKRIMPINRFVRPCVSTTVYADDSVWWFD